MTQMKTTGKKVSIIRNRKRQSEEVFQQLRYKLRKNNFILTEKHPDIVISIGGDGMLLSAFHKYEHQLDRVRFVGVHTGHLGFYTDYLDSEIDKLVENLKYDTGAKVSYPILNVKITFENGETRTMRALNEATIKRSDRTMVADLTINGVDFERFRGDGITVSTPTGSTASINPWEEQFFTRLLKPCRLLKLLVSTTVFIVPWVLLSLSLKRIRLRLHRRDLASTLSLSIIQPILTAILER